MARRLSDDRGMALAIAIGVMLVLSITVTSVISYTSAGSRSTNLSLSEQRAGALAEAGINNALSILSRSGSDSEAIRPQPAYAGDPNSTVTTYQGGGTATWGAAWTSATKTWTIKSIGSVPNPTGPSASDVTRTIYGSAVIAAPPYSFVSLNSLCEKHTLTVRSSGTLVVTNAIYTNSCDMGNDGFDVFGTGGSISSPDIRVVGGWETHDGNPVIVNGTTCPVLAANPPALGDPGTPVAGCPLIGQPVLPDPFVEVRAPALGTPACTSPVYGSDTSYAVKAKLNAPITASDTTLTYNTAPVGSIQVGHLIKIDTEYMLVIATDGGVGVTVQRAANGSTAASHDAGKEIKYKPVVATAGTAATPASCIIASGTVTLNPGTYYGGICIGAADCSGIKCVPSDVYGAVAYSPARKITAAMTIAQTTLVTDGATIANGDYIKIENEWMLVTGGGGTTNLTIARAQFGSVAASHGSGKAILNGTLNPTAHVTLAPGNYIMAGGGFRVCGAAVLSAPNVLVYNTQDPTSPTGAGALDGVLVNTNGSVALGPQTAGTYAGLTIFQDRNLALLPASKCDGRAGRLEQFDIGMLSAASTGANGALGSISGTIYSPALHSIFVSTVSGRANLALMTSCILIDGGNAIYDFQPSGLFGVGLQLARQWG